MVVIEDVDLIAMEATTIVAEDRSRAPIGAGPLLFELLNDMDGLAADAISCSLATGLMCSNQLSLRVRVGSMRLSSFRCQMPNVAVGCSNSTARASASRLMTLPPIR